MTHRAFLVNVGRRQSVVAADLVEVLNDGQMAGTVSSEQPAVVGALCHHHASDRESIRTES
jgi:phosphoglycerate dehydrogenase-like enzyme